jgi:hypothetical protein
VATIHEPLAKQTTAQKEFVAYFNRVNLFEEVRPLGTFGMKHSLC